MDLKRCAQNKNQLERQVGKLTTEKDKLQKLVQDAKSALKRAAGLVLSNVLISQSDVKFKRNSLGFTCCLSYNKMSFTISKVVFAFGNCR